MHPPIGGKGEGVQADLKALDKDALNSALRQAIPSYEESKRRSLGRKRESLSLERSARRNEQETQRFAQERRQASLYAGTKHSIAGLSVVSSLQPRLGVSVERSNVYALRTGQVHRRSCRNWEKLPSIRQREINEEAIQVAPQTVRTQFPLSGPQVQASVRLNRTLALPISQPSPIQATNLNSFLKDLLQNKSEASVFHYFNLKGEDPYDLEMTTYANRNTKKYFTVSRKGVTKYENEVVTEMVTLKEWLTEREMYRELKEYSFFRNFHRWKLLNSWRNGVRTARREFLKRELEDKMFVLDPVYREHLLRYRRHVWEMSKLRVVNATCSATVGTLEEFAARQWHKRRETGNRVKECSKVSREVVRKLISQALDRLRKRILFEIVENNKSSASKLPARAAETPGSRNAALRSISFPENMTYGHRSALRRECSRFLRLAYLLDFMAAKSLGEIYTSSVRELLDTLAALHTVQPEASGRVAKAEPLVVVKARIEMDREIPEEAVRKVAVERFSEKMSKAKEFDVGCHVEMSASGKGESSRVLKKYFKSEVENIGRYWVESVPSKEVFFEKLLECLSEGMKSLETFERWSRHKELQQYVDVLENWDDIVGDDWSPGDDNVVIPLDVIEDDPLYITHEKTLKNIVDSGYARCSEFLRSLDKYLNLCWRSKVSDFKVLCDERVCKPGETLSNVVRLLNYQKNVFAAKLPETYNLGFLKLDCRPIRRALMPIPGRYISEVQSMMNDELSVRLSRMEEWIEDARGKLEVAVETVDDYIVQRVAWNEVANAYKEFKEKIDVVGELYDAMNSFELKVNRDGRKKYPKVLQEMNKLGQLIASVSDQQELALDKNKKKLQDQLVPKLQQSLEDVKTQIEDEMFLTYKENVDEIVERVGLLDEEFRELSAQCRKYNGYQEKLSVEVHSFDIVSDIAEQLSLRKLLWTSLKGWKELTEKWTAQQFSAIDPKEINTAAEDYSQIAFKLDNELPENPVSKQLKQKVDTFARAVPTIRALRNELLKKSHWKDIKALLRAEFEVANPEFTLRSLFELEAAKHADEIEQISVQATRENLLERKVASVDARCRSCSFVFEGDVAVANIDEVRNVIDECMIDIVSVLDDKYVSPFLAQAEEWHKTLTVLNAIMDEWAACQSQWTQLYEVFSFNELRTQLVGESAKFDAQDKFLKELVQKAAKTLSPLKFVKSYKGDLLEQFRYANKVFDEIRKALSDFAETKQAAFPRFYFLAGREIIKILSSPQRLSGIDEYLPKLFDSVVKILFNENGEAVSVSSREGERLQLFKPVRQKDTTEGCLEQLETSIRETLARAARTAVDDHDEAEPRNWIARHPAQVALAVSKAVWCSATENALVELPANANALIEWYEEMTHEIQQLTEFKKCTLPSHTKTATLNILLTKLHYKDIVEELILESTSSLTDHNWQKVLKFYWEEEESTAPISVKMLSYKLTYGGEYIFPAELTITGGVTDRMWISIAGALSGHTGVGLFGACETGKRETVRSLARSIGTYCVEVKCGHESGYRLFSRSIAGAASIGAWICVQGIDKAETGLLSVISRQLVEIKRAFSRCTQSLLINEKEVQVKEGCGIFAMITRQEFLELKVEGFRIISAIEPDIGHILAILLLVENFSQPKVLANKLVVLKDIMNEVLKNSIIGLQCLKIIVKTASALKTSCYPPINEDSAILAAIKLLLEPKIQQEDMEVFNSIIADIFPKVKLATIKDTAIIEKLTQALIDSKLSNIPALVEKAVQLATLIKAHTGIVVAGCPASGKSTIIHLLANTCNAALSRLNPQALTLGELYGGTSPAAQEWRDGLVPKMLRKAAEQWVVFDGPVTSEWTGGLNLAAAESSALCLGNGERICLADKAKIFFETDNLRESSPAIVSRCGLLYLDSNYINHKSYVEGWLNKTYGANSTFPTPELRLHILQLFEDSMERALTKARSSCAELTNTNDCQLVSSVCSILEGVLAAENFVNEKADRKRVVAQSYWFAFVWGVGGALDEGGREKIDSIVRSVFENSDFPPAQPVFEYCIDPQKGERAGFRLWSDMIPPFAFNLDTAFSEIVVPTIETTRLDYFISHLTSKSKNIFIKSNTVCGKSLIVRDILQKSSAILLIPASLPPNTKASTMQFCIESKLQLLRNDLYGTAEGKRNVIFIDDAHLPLADASAAELIRQLVDHKSWYSRTSLMPKGVENTSVLCIGKGEHSARLKRHFSQFWVPAITNGALENIFKAILEENMKSREFPEEMRVLVQDIVSNTTHIYSTIHGRLKATPGKFAYAVSPRDLARVFEGFCSVPSNAVSSVQSLANLWTHEVSRTFIDGIGEESEKDWVGVLVADCASKVFKLDVDLRLYWTSYKTPTAKVYREVTDLNEIKNLIKAELEEYAKVNAEGCNIIIYNEMVENLLKIIHGLEQTKDCLLVVGNAGIGKSTLIKLAAFMQRFALKEPNSFECLQKMFKRLLLSSGVEGNYECLLVSQKSCALSKEMLEMLHVLLLNGQIPGLFSKEEIEKILADMHPAALELSRNVSRKSLNKVFTERIKERLKIVLACEPGRWLQKTARTFPSVAKSCRTVFLSSWSPEALQAIACRTLGVEECSEESVALVRDLCREVHNSMLCRTEEYNSQCSDSVKITPSFYLDALRQFRELSCRSKATQSQSAFAAGYANYKELKARGSRSDAEVEALINAKTEQLEQLQQEILNDQAGVKELEESLVAKSQALEQENCKLKALREEAQSELSYVKLNEITEKVSQCHFLDVNKEHMVTEAVIILIDEKTANAPIDNGDELVKKLKEVVGRIEYIPSCAIRKVKDEYVGKAEFRAEDSAIINLLAQWVEAVIECYQVHEKAVLKKQQLEMIVQKLEEEVKEHENEINTRKGRLARTEAAYEDAQTERKRLAEELSGARFKSDRVAEFLELFAADEARWEMVAAEGRASEEAGVGNLLFASLFVVYLGQFPMNFRKRLIAEWKLKFNSMGLNFDPDLCLASEKQSKAASTSKFITDSIAILQNSCKWPLIIDPHSLGRNWIKAQYAKSGLIITKFSQKDYMRNLLYAMSMGKPLLIEDVDFIEPALESIIAKGIIERDSRSSVVYIEGREYDYDRSFKLFMTTKGSVPANAEKLAVVNFATDEEAFEETAKEKLMLQVPELGEEKALASQVARDRELLKEIDEKVMAVFASDSLLEFIEDDRNYEIVKNLKASYQSSLAKLQENQKVYAEYLEQMNEYKKIVKRAGAIYGVASQFVLVFAEYKFSLQNFTEVFTAAIKPLSSLPHPKRIEQLKNGTISKLFTFIAQGMSKSHKIVFALLACLKIQEIEHKVPVSILDYLTREDLKLEEEKRPLESVIDSAGWGLAQVVSKELPQFAGLLESFAADSSEWEVYGKGLGGIPKQWNKALSSADKILVAKIFCKRKLSLEFVEFIRQSNLPLSLEDKYEIVLEQATKFTPILLISPEASAFSQLHKLALKKHCEDRLHTVSLGPDQSQQARKSLQAAQSKGDWLLVDNCHCTEGGGKELEALLEAVKEPKSASHEEFRAFFAATQAALLPRCLVECSVKIRLHHLEGIEERARAGYEEIKDMACDKRDGEFRRVMLGVVIFHAVVAETSRNKGFSREYAFPKSCLVEAADAVRNAVEESEEISWDSLEFSIADVIYSGIMSDESDRRKLQAMFRVFCNSDASTQNAGPDVLEDRELLGSLLRERAELPGIAELSGVREESDELIETIRKLQLRKRVDLEETLETSSMANWVTTLAEMIPLQLHTTV